MLLDLTVHNNEFLSVDIVQFSAQYLEQSCAVNEKVVQLAVHGSTLTHMQFVRFKPTTS